MESWMIFTSGFIIGFTSAAMLTVSMVIWQGRKVLTKRKDALKKFTDEMDALMKRTLPGGKNDASRTVDERLLKVKELTDTQMSLQAQIETPQRNDLDGKYKNSLSREVAKIDEEKSELLNSIIKDGHNPSISVMGDDGVVETMLLSEFMIRLGMNVDIKKDEVKPTTKPSVVPSKDKSPFTVHKGGKDDEKPSR
jgi:hypothetical protein